MKLVRVHAENRFSIDEVPTPNPGPRDVVVRVGACGVCGSDVHFVRSGFLRPGGEPLPLGHEAAGTVETVGADVKGITPGMRVFINPDPGNGDVIGNGGREGAFADLLLIRDAQLGEDLMLIPDDMTFAEAAIVEPLAVGLHGVNRGNVGPDTKAVVFGCGPIGLGAVFWLRRRGVKSVVAVDVSDQRLNYARQLGADATINPKNEDLRVRLIDLHGKGIAVMGQDTVGSDVFFDMAGGRTVIADIVKMAQYHARLVISAVYLKPLEIDLLDVLMRELAITTAGGYPSELKAVLAELPSIGKDALTPYISHRFPFAEFEQAFATAQQADSAKVMVEFA